MTSATTSTSALSSFLNALESFSFSDIASAISGGGKNLGADIASAEDLASAVVGALAASGNGIALTVEQVLPAAIGIINSAEAAFGLKPNAPAPATAA